MQHKAAYIMFIGCSLVLALVFLFTTPEQVGAIGSADEADQLVGLLSGQPVPSTAPRGNGSILGDEDFANAGLRDAGNRVSESGLADDYYNDEEPDVLDGAHPDNPVNPATGERYPDSIMEQFGGLRERFPGNDIIPRRMSPEERRAKEQERAQIFQVNAQIAQGTATPDQVDRYYDYQQKGFRDRLEILDYLIEKRGDQMSAEVLERYTKIRDAQNQQLNLIDQQRQRAHERINR